MARTGLDNNLSSQHLDLAKALSLFFFLAGIYLFTYNGLFRSIAELSMFSLTESLVQDGSFDTPQLLFSQIHNPIGDFEILQPLLTIPLYLLAYQQPWLGNIQTVMLFNILVTPATAIIIWMILGEMGYRPQVRIGGALIFGLATMAWPYSRTFLREPLVGLFYASAFLALLRYRHSGQWFWAGFCLGAMLLSMTVKLTSLLALPVFALAIYFSSSTEMRSRLWRVGLGVILAGGVIFGLVIWQRWGADWLNYLLRPIVAGGTVIDSLFRLWGLTFSPGKGLFIYSPVLVLGIWGGIILRRERRIEMGTIFGIALLYLLAYSRRKGWFGGLDWGPRYMVPLIPLLALPVVEVFSSTGWKRWLVLALVALSSMVQMVASTANYSIYYQELVKSYPKPENSVLLDPGNFGLSPVVGQFQIWRPQDFDLIWWRAAGPERPPVLDLSILSLLLMITVIAGGFFWYAQQERPRLGIRFAWAGAIISFGLGAPLFLAQAYKVEANYWYTDPESLREVAGQIDSAPALVVSVSNDFHHLWLKNYLKGDFRHYWFSPLQSRDLEALRPPTAEVRNIYLVTDSIPPNSPDSHVEQWLNRESFRYNAEWMGPYVLFEYAPPLSLTMQVVSHRFGQGIALVGFGQEGAVERGGILRLEFNLQKVGVMDGDYTLFAHLLSSQGVFIAGTDGQPQFGAAPTSLWEEGELIVDRRGIPIPEDIPPGAYQIEIGFYRDGQRLTLHNLDGKPADSLIIGEVLIK